MPVQSGDAEGDALDQRVQCPLELRLRRAGPRDAVVAKRAIPTGVGCQKVCLLSVS